MQTLFQDLRYGIRLLFRNPGFTLVAVITLALGIGANTAMFSVVNAVLLRPLPFPKPDRLVMLFHSYPRINLARASVSAPGFVYYRDQAQSYENMAAVTTRQAPQNLTGVGTPERVRSALVSAGFFPTLQVRPVLGRAFLPEEDQPGRNHEVVLSYGFWQRHYAGDREVVGKTVTLDGIGYNIVGVMPAGFDFPDRTDLWTPIAFAPTQLSDFTEYLSVIARMKPGVSVAQAQAELDKISGDLRRQFPNVFTGSLSDWHVVLAPLRELFVESSRRALLVLQGAVAFVLLIVCANLANLLLARATKRQKEIAIRTALGAGQGRIIRQLLTESVLLSLVGGALGLLLALWGIDLLLRWLPSQLPGFVALTIDRRVLGFTVVLSVLTGLMFGSVPAAHAFRVDLNQSLKEGGRETSPSSRQNRVRSLLVVAEMALAVLLLTGFGLMAHSLVRLQRADFGFDPQKLLTMGVILPSSKYQSEDQVTSFYRQVLENISAQPGVEYVGAASCLPLGSNWTSSYAIEGRPTNPAPHAYVATVSPNYFYALHVPLLKGRYFEDSDRKPARPVAIIDQRTAQAFWANEDPIGKRIAFTFEGSRANRVWREIVGVVGSVKHTSALNLDTKGEVYLPYQQVPIPFMMLAVRTSSDPLRMIAAVRDAVLQVDKEQPVFDVKSMDLLLSEYVAAPRIHTLLLGTFAGLALLLACLGIYGVLSYLVSQRTHEIGVRIALGAQTADVLRLVVKQGIVLTLIGMATGLVASFALTRVLSGLLFEVRATDPTTFAVVPLVLAAVALPASYIPARRATKVDPMVALRHE